MNSHFACNEEIKRLKKELAIADRFGEDMYRKVQNLEAMMKQTPTKDKLIDELQSQRDELVDIVREVADAHFDLSLHKQHDTLSYLKHSAQEALAKLDEQS